MKKITYLLLIVTGLLFTTLAFTQKDTKAKEILDKTSAMLNQSGGISASFTINVNDDANNMKEGFEGQMLLKNTKFFVETPDQKVYFDGKTQWIYFSLFDEVTILEPSPQDLHSLNPILVFNMYKTDCDYKYNGEKTDNQRRRVHEVSLFPKKRNEDIKQINMQINKVDNMPVFFHIIYKNNMELRIHLSKYQTKQNLPDSQFVFDKNKFPYAEVNDLR